MSIRSTPPYGKLYFYKKILQFPTNLTYDPYEVSIEVRYLENEVYILRSLEENGRFWIPELKLFLGIWQGKRLCQTMNWLRWWDRVEICCCGVANKWKSRSNVQNRKNNVLIY